MELTWNAFIQSGNLDYRRSIKNIIDTICTVMESENA